jgi:hypothetical protein
MYRIYHRSVFALKRKNEEGLEKKMCDFLSELFLFGAGVLVPLFLIFFTFRSHLHIQLSPFFTRIILSKSKY